MLYWLLYKQWVDLFCYRGDLVHPDNKAGLPILRFWVL